MEEVYKNDKLCLHLKAEYKEIADPQDQSTEFHLYTHVTTFVGPTKYGPCKDAHFSIKDPRFVLPKEESESLILDLVSQAGPLDCSSTRVVKDIICNFHEDVAHESLYAPTGAVIITADLRISVAHPLLRVTMQKHGFNKDHDECKSCAICMDEFEQDMAIYMTPCRHLFHKECISEWRKTSKTCPICRYEF